MARFRRGFPVTTTSIRPSAWSRAEDLYRRRSGYDIPMAIATRELYFETGLDVLSDLGFGGLKMTEVCARIGVTTGSFYHYFPSWQIYTRELLEYWRKDRTVRVIEALNRVPGGPRERFEAGIQPALPFPHNAEAAIRVWSSVDPHVSKVQTEVDQQRFDHVFRIGMETVRDPRQAEIFAHWCMYVFIGFEQATLSRDPAMFEWIVLQALDALESGAFASVPPRLADDGQTEIVEHADDGHDGQNVAAETP